MEIANLSQSTKIYDRILVPLIVLYSVKYISV